MAAYSFNLDTMDLQSVIQVGKNMEIKGIVDKYDAEAGIFYLKPVSIADR